MYAEDFTLADSSISREAVVSRVFAGQTTAQDAANLRRVFCPSDGEAWTW
jgi:hypothetical protein